MHAVGDHVKGIEERVTGERWRVRQDVPMPPRAPAERATAALRADILSGTFAVGRFLPGLRELSEQYGVAYNTIRQALKVLAAEGLVEVIPQRGSMVLSPIATVELEWSADGHVQPAGQGLGAGVDLQVGVRLADGAVAAALQLLTGASVTVRQSVLVHGGAPWAVRRLYVPQDLVDSARLLGSPGPVDEGRALEEAGMAETGQRTRWTVQPADPEESRLLESGASALHLVRRVGYHDQRPVSCEVLTIRTDRVVMSQLSGTVPPENELPD